MCGSWVSGSVDCSQLSFSLVDGGCTHNFRKRRITQSRNSVTNYQLYWFVYMWVQSSVWLFTMKEYNKTSLIRSPSNFTIWIAMKLDLESYFDVSKLDVWLDVLEFWFEVEGRWLDLKLNWRKISTLIWRSRNEPWFWGSKDALLDLEMTLHFGKVSIGFFSLSFSHFFHMKSLYL